jgi:hypothetical protein
MFKQMGKSCFSGNLIPGADIVQNIANAKIGIGVKMMNEVQSVWQLS